MPTVIKYRIKYLLNNLTNEHEESTLEKANTYILLNNLTNVAIEEIQENIPNFYPLRVIELLHSDYKSYYPTRIAKIDIRKHLQPSIILKKFISNIINGRPDEAIYCLEQKDQNNNVSWLKIARIKFEFILDPITQLCVSRKEILGFYNTNDKIDTDYEFEISSEQYQFYHENGQPNLYDIYKMSAESEQTLRAIISNLKMKINAILCQIYLPQGKTYNEVLNIGVALLEKYEKAISIYEKSGKGTFKQDIQNDIEFTWLNFDLGQGYTIRNLIMDTVA